MLMKKIVRELKLTKSNILDIGCYNGSFLMTAQGYKNKLYGIDASRYAYEHRVSEEIIFNRQFITDSVLLPYRSSLFDLVIAGEIIEHMYDTDHLLMEIRRVLKSNGLLLMSTPNIASLGRRILLAFGKSPIIEISIHEKESVGHIRYFTFETVQKLLEKHNFSVIKKISDVINFEPSGRFTSRFFARLFPTLGASCIVLAKSG
jgi:2-polyprenyl-3-methyl-5-hydroxy-6-metoxy-1,4-benzoquinol methylase